VVANVRERGRAGAGMPTPMSFEVLLPEGISLPQGAYHVDIADDDPQTVFFVPIGMSAGRLRLEAVFA